MNPEDLFETAAIFYPPAANQDDPKRQALIDELMTILDKSQFINKQERDKIKKVIPIFENAVIAELKQTFIRQNLRFLQGKMTDLSAKK